MRSIRSSVASALRKHEAFLWPQVETNLRGKPRGALLDVGANVGQFSLTIFSRFAEVYAFEPWYQTAREFEKNQSAVGAKNVRVIRAAVGDVAGIVGMTIFQTSVFNAVKRPNELPRETPVDGSAPVPIVRLDDLIGHRRSRARFVKVDVEGHEAFVLRGAEKTLRDDRPHVLVEAHAPELGRECEAILAGIGYAPEVIRNPGYDDEARRARHYFIFARGSDE